ncbi:MAG: hypothetical protein EON60_07570 [Alphaproteobacteria bacterium]|nr:MAG: hypothetical protein EON60_07570 [Alphaproteobacteria bacterium]
MTETKAFDGVADVLVVSDLHAMSPDVDVERFIRFVDLHPAKKLVLAGDTLDFYMWRHGRTKLDTKPATDVLDYLLKLADIGVEVLILPGNHDVDWAWLTGNVCPPKRYARAQFPDGLKEQIETLLAMENVAVSNVIAIGGAMIVHGHEGWEGDWLWRMSEWGDRATGYKLVGGQMRRKIMGGAPLSVRAAAVQGHGFYRRLAKWGLKMGVKHVIHGHTHVHGKRHRYGVVIDCLPAWRPSEGPGGGMLLKDGQWETVLAT